MMRKNDGFLAFLNIIRQHWKILSVCSIACAVLGYFSAKFFLSPRYRADVLIYIGRVEYDGFSSSQLQRREDPSAVLSRELYVSSQLVLDYTELIKSKMIMSKAIEEIVKNNPEYTIPAKGNLPARVIPFQMESSTRKNTRLLTLSVTAQSPDAACFIANTLSQIFVEEISSLLGLKNFQIIDRASKAYKTYPVLWMFAAAAFFLAAGALIAYFALKASLDTRFHTSEKLANALKLPIIGSVPIDKEMAKQDGSPEKSGTDRIVTLGSGQALDQKRFGIREAFWGIRTNLLYSDFRSTQGARIIAVTSALPGEGKTFVATNLAATLADFEHRTLIINCDLRKPTLSLALNTYKSEGLVNVLIDHYPVEKALLKNLFQRQLDALLCGPIPLNPLKLLDSAEFKNLLQEMRKSYDYIILDTPPCLEVSDGICLGKMADGIILVSRLELLREANAAALLELLRQAKVTPLGVVVNGVSTDHSGYYQKNYGFEATGKKA